MHQKRIILLAIVVLVSVGYLLFNSNTTDDEDIPAVLSAYAETVTFNSDTAITDNHIVVEGEALVLENSAVLTTQADLVIDGALGCRDGSITLVAEGQLTINDTVVCQNADKGNVTIIAKGGLVMSDSAEIIASGDIQIVDGESVVRTESELAILYDEVETIPETGFVIGPFVDEDTVVPEVDDEVIVSLHEQPFFEHFFNVAHAQVANGTTTVNLTGEPIIVSGKLKIDTPWRGARRIVVFDFPNTREVTIQDFELEGPDGRVGDPDSGSCDVKGKDGEDAFRFNAFAPNLKVNNFTLTLGDGGEGGEATTGSDCENATAKGGKGGKPGNFRMVGAQKFEIVGAFIIHPGTGGAGGGATATGKEGDAGEKGGDANATGGNGSDNKKNLTVGGTVGGTNNVQFGDAVGGFGGSSLAEGGKGGDGDKCGMEGGQGGKATSQSGKGGDAKLSVSGGAGRMAFANDIGGNGGIVEAYGGAGGAGGSCDSEAPGGDGGKGGNASATEGKGGQGKSGPASDGTVLGDDGGDGGNGGDGCTEGIGGEGGSGGIEDGERGEDGKNLCLSITKEEDFISLLPGEIQVIQYRDYFIPISNLVTYSDESGNECGGAEHWHPGANGAINLRGMAVPDPDPNECGFGKTSEVPIIIVQDPNYVEESSDSGGGNQIRVEGLEGLRTGGGVEMIQVDPPTLVIPAQ